MTRPTACPDLSAVTARTVPVMATTFYKGNFEAGGRKVQVKVARVMSLLAGPNFTL